MSGSTPAPSPYGRGPYGMGRYSRNEVAIGNPAPTLGADRVRLSASVQVTAFKWIASSSLVGIGGTKMWDPVDVPPCQPWFLVSRNPGCYLSLGNSFGSAFPGAAS